MSLDAVAVPGVGLVPVAAGQLPEAEVDPSEAEDLLAQLVRHHPPLEDLVELGEQATGRGQHPVVRVPEILARPLGRGVGFAVEQPLQPLAEILDLVVGERRGESPRRHDLHQPVEASRVHGAQALAGPACRALRDLGPDEVVRRGRPRLTADDVDQGDEQEARRPREHEAVAVDPVPRRRPDPGRDLHQGRDHGKDRIGVARPRAHAVKSGVSGRREALLEADVRHYSKLLTAC
jgi:hypothetical protein